MRFGLHTGQHGTTFADLVSLWRDAAAWGFDACYLFDHIVPLHSDVEAFLPEEASSPLGPCLEGVTALAALSRAVPRAGVGMMVAGVGYRTAGYLAHATATLARAAPGRLEIGVGAGWFTPDYRIMGLPLPAPKQRLDALEAALGVVREAARSMGDPPRVWTAGVGERRTIPIAAHYADSWNAMYLTPEEFAGKVEVLERACAAIGRDASTIERSIALRAFCAPEPRTAAEAFDRWVEIRGGHRERMRERSLVGTPEECAAQIRRYAAAGADHITVMAHPPYDRVGLELLGANVFSEFR